MRMRYTWNAASSELSQQQQALNDSVLSRFFHNMIMKWFIISAFDVVSDWVGSVNLTKPKAKKTAKQTLAEERSESVLVDIIWHRISPGFGARANCWNDKTICTFSPHPWWLVSTNCGFTGTSYIHPCTQVFCVLMLSTVRPWISVSEEVAEFASEYPVICCPGRL